MLDLSIKTILLFLIFIFSSVTKTFQAEFVVFANNNVGSSRIVKRQSSQLDVPNIKKFLVTTNVANRFAETSVISTVENSDSYTKQTAFSVVLPERAYISGFFMEIDGTRYKGYVKEKEEARRIFAQSLSTGQTAGHVSVSTRYSNRFTVNVNVEPLTKVTFNLNYEELLQRENSQYEIITNIQPGQIVKKLRVEVFINESLPLLFVRTPYLRSGSNALLQHNTNLDPHANVRVYNTSARVVFEPDVSRQLEFACAGLGNKEYNGFAGQFVVKYDVDRTNEGGETIYQDGFLLNFFAPKPQSFDPLPKHIVFVLDTSGSMEGLKLTQLMDAMLKILPQLNDVDVFSIVQYASNVYVWDLDWTENNVLAGRDPEVILYGNLAKELENTYIAPAHAATEENINKVKDLIKQLNAFDATNAIGALEIGLLVIQKAQLQFPNKYTPIMVFLTDGLPNVGVTDTNEIIHKINTINKAAYNTPIYSLCFGSDADWLFLKTLSLQTEAKLTNISESDDASVLLQDFYKTISNPILSNVTYNLPKSVEATQTRFKLFFNGSEQVFAAKGVPENETKTITVSAKSAKGPVNLESQLGVPLTKLEKIWAYLTVKQLADQYQATGNTTFSKLALDLALNYSLVSDFTSLVVVKPDSDGGPIEPEDASVGIFPEPPGELPMCNNITDWIIDNYGTTEDVITTDLTTELPVTIGDDILESNIGITEKETTTTTTTTTETPTTTTEMVTTTTTTEKIITCAESTYGCCHDGITFAPGPNGDGCDPIPSSESCSLPFDKGTCNNITTKWFYNIGKHKCRPFRYSGCGGTDNRFATRKSCEHTCVYPKDTERCKLPISLGNCNKRILHWFYDKAADECVKYLYGGCDGNSNRFHSKLECLKICSPPKLKKTIKNLCFQPKDKGRPGCRRFELNYYFDSSTGHCLKFRFNGCGGNDNRFTNKDVCEKMCIYSKNRAICNAPPERGSCTGYYKLYYFDTKTSTCKQFIFGGCGGNRNKFFSQEECENFCMNVQD